VGLGWVGVAFAAGGPAAGVAAGDAAGVDQADDGELGSEFAVALLVVGEPPDCGPRRPLSSGVWACSGADR